MMPPTSIDGTDITGATIDGTDVQEITVDGQTVFQSTVIPNLVDIRLPMDEGSGTTLNDEFGNNNGELVNGAGWQADTDATGGFVTQYAANNQLGRTVSPIPCNESQQTVMFWITWDGTQTDRYWGAIGTSPDGLGQTDVDGWRSLYATSGPGLYTEVYENGSNTNNASTAQLTINEAYFVAYAFDGNSVTQYIYDNNGLVGSFPFTGARGDQGVNKYLIWFFSTVDDGGGFVDDVMVNTTTELSQAQITSIYNETFRL